MFRNTRKWLGRGPAACRQDFGTGHGRSAATGADGLADGLVAGTPVATALGWRPVEAIMPGDPVLTFDRGMMPVHSVTRGAHWDRVSSCPRSLLPLSVPAGALGNADPLNVLPEQSLMIESDAGDDLFGDPFSLVKAADLEGFRGIERHVPDRSLDVVQLHFEQDEVVFVGSGALALCAGRRFVTVGDIMCTPQDGDCYGSLDSAQAAMLLDELRGDDALAQCLNSASQGGRDPGSGEAVASCPCYAA